MNTIHDEMIKRFNEKYIEIYGTLYDAKSAVIKSFFLSEIDIAVKSEREKTIDECIACVPNKEKEKDISEYEDYEDFVLSVCYKVFNTCREQTITNLNQLKNNG